MLARYSGQRRGDVLKMARTAYDGCPSKCVRRRPTNRWSIRAHRRLKAYLDALPKASLLFVVDAIGPAHRGDGIQQGVPCRA